MEAKEFMVKYGAMCNSFEYCDDCPLSTLKEAYCIQFCSEVLINHTDEAIAIVTAYSNRKTRQSEYLNIIQVPYSSYSYGVLDICPSHAKGFVGCDVTDKTCMDCKRDFWLEEIK